MKKRILLFAFIISFFGVRAQVSLQSGTLQKSIPIYSYNDLQDPNLKLNLSLEYNSMNGLTINEMPGVVGTGWSLEGIPKIIRIQKSLPDDQLEITGAWNTFQRPSGYISNNSVQLGCPNALNSYPTFFENNHIYYQNNKTTADREMDEFRVEIGDRIIRFVLDKNGGNCINLDNSRVKIIPGGSSLGNITVYPVNTIRGFTVIDEDGTIYDFSEAEVYRSFVYDKDFALHDEVGNSILRSRDPLNGPEYVVNAWYISSIKPSVNSFIGKKIVFEYTKQIYDFKYVKMERGEVSATPYPIIVNSPAPFRDNWYKGEYSANLPAPYNTTVNAYFKYFKLLGREIRTYIEKKEIAHIHLPNNQDINFEYLLARKDLVNTNALSKIKIGANNTVQSSIDLEYNYFIKNSISQPLTSQEEKWSRLCLTSVKNVGADGSLALNPYLFDYYTGSNSTEDFVPPPFFHAQDPFGFYNGDYSGTPTDRMLVLDRADMINWAKVCFHYNATITGGADEIVFNPKPNYAKNGLLKSIQLPTGGKEVYEYEQNFVYPTIQNSSGLKYKSFTTRLSSGGFLEHAYGGVSLSKITMVNQGGGVDKFYKYDYLMPDGTSSRWGAEAGKVKSAFTNYYKAEEETLDPITGNCTYEYRYAAFLQQIPVTAVPEEISSFQKIFNIVLKSYQVASAAVNIKKNPKNFGIQAMVTYVIKWVVTAIVTCYLTPVPEETIYIDETNYNLINSNALPSQFSRAKVSEFSANGNPNGNTIYEFTTPAEYPLLVPYEVAELSNKPRGYFWMYGLPKKITIRDNSDIKIKQVENLYSDNNQILSSSNTLSCDCKTTYISSKRADNWLNPSTFTSYTTTSNSNLKVDFYNIAVGGSFLTSAKETLFKNNNALETTTTFTQNSLNKQIAKISSINSKGNTIETRNYYIEDYNLNNAANSVLQQMKGFNIVNMPVSSETWQIKPNQTPELLSASITEFGLTPSSEFRPVKTYNLKTDKPVPQNVIGIFDPNNIVRNPALMKQTAAFNYDYPTMSPKEIEDVVGNKAKAFIYSYPSGLPIATISNANANECDYLPAGSFTVNSMFFSRWVYKDSKVTFWANSGNKIKVAVGFWNGVSMVFNDLNPTISENIVLGKIYYEYSIPNGYRLEVRNENSCEMNEFRFYPSNAFMQTVTYDLSGKAISECDVNNRTTYYEYDALGRLSKILDEKHNIIKTYEYHLKN